MLIKVTQEHIDKGTPLLAYECPIALAFQDAYKRNDIGASVDFIDFNNERFFELPSVASAWLLNFDDDNVVKPFEFEFDLESAREIIFG